MTIPATILTAAEQLSYPFDPEELADIVYFMDKRTVEFLAALLNTPVARKVLEKVK